MIRGICLAFWVFYLALQPLHAETRLALVIGNSGYRHVTTLPNPVSDANLIAHALRAQDFDVTLLTDAELGDLKRAIAVYGRELRAAGPDATAVFYYAGHGVQVQGANYLIPVDADIADEADLYLTSVEASWVLRQMESARNRTSIVILDACRDNPFAEQGLREAGLARMDAPTGSFVAYSTGPGEVASDGNGLHSPFTAALAQRMSERGVPVEEMFRKVRGDVLRATRGQQTPWDSSSLIAEFFFAGAAAASPVDPAEQRLWDSVKDSGDLVELALFLRAYPDSTYATEARRRLVASSTSDVPTEADTAEPAPVQPATAESVPEADREAREFQMISEAQETSSAAAYKAYLEEFPDGTFAELARMELAALNPGDAADPAPAAPSAPVAAAPAEDSASLIEEIARMDVRFSAPIPVPLPHVEGRALSEIVKGSPQFPPIEGLDEVIWKGKPCSTCHQWSQEALCTQGHFYLEGDEDRIEGKKHPLGRAFLYALRRWAETGCG